MIVFGFLPLLRMYFREVRQTLRRLGNNRRFSCSVILTLALGIGATVSVFSIIHAVMITPLPYDDPSRLFSVFESKVGNDEGAMDAVAPGNFLDLRAQNQTFTDLAAYFGPHFNLTGNGEPRHLRGSAASPVLFAILGAQPMLGRTFLSEEDSYSAPHVVLLSYHLWSGSFHSDPQIVGKTISLNGDPYNVVVVLRPSFVDPDNDETDLWVPLQQQIRPDRMIVRDAHFLGVLGRLRPGVTLDQARADMNRIAAQLKMQNPTSDSGSGAVVMSLQKAIVGETGKSLLLALGIVVLVLLIASSNVAILMLARTNGRSRELAVRTALGASTSQILREVLSESVILGVFSGLLGLVFAVVGRKLFLQFASYSSNVELIRINPAVLAFALFVSVIVGLGFGLLPAIKLLRTDVQRILRSSGNASTIGAGGRFLRHTLLVGEISLSIVLLVGTGLLLRSMQNLQHQPLGFRTERLIAHVDRLAAYSLSKQRRRSELLCSCGSASAQLARS
jgi:putative ABC transport system permease protein